MSTEAPNVFALEQSEGSSLTADFSWTFVGNAIYAAGQFAILMLLTKLVQVELVGQYALGLALVYPVMMLSNMQLRSVMNSSVRDGAQFGHYLSLRLLMTLAAFAAIFGITRILRYDWQLTEVVLMVGVAYGIETISDGYYARLQLHDRMAEISKSLMARAVLSVLILAAVTYATRSVVWGIAGVAVGRAIVLFGYDTRERYARSTATNKMVFVERGTRAAIRCRRTTPTSVAKPSAWNRRAFDHAKFQHSQFFSSSMGLVNATWAFLRAGIDDLRRQHGRRLTRTIRLHTSIQSVRKRKYHGLRLAARCASHLWSRPRRLRHAHFEIRGARDSYPPVPARVCRTG